MDIIPGGGGEPGIAYHVLFVDLEVLGEVADLRRGFLQQAQGLVPVPVIRQGGSDPGRVPGAESRSDGVHVPGRIALVIEMQDGLPLQRIVRGKNRIGVHARHHGDAVHLASGIGNIFLPVVGEGLAKACGRIREPLEESVFQPQDPGGLDGRFESIDSPAGSEKRVFLDRAEPFQVRHRRDGHAPVRMLDAFVQEEETGTFLHDREGDFLEIRQVVRIQILRPCGRRH